MNSLKQINRKKIMTTFDCALNLMKAQKLNNEIINYSVDVDTYGNRTIYIETNQGTQSVWCDVDYFDNSTYKFDYSDF